MTSKLVVNTIEADTGISSVSFASSISMSSTSKFHFSNAGIDIGADTNINRPAAGVLGFNISGAEKLRVDTNGHLNTSGIVTAANFKTGVTNLHSTGLTLTGGQLDVGSNIKIGTAGVVTATSFVGSGANLTGISQVGGSTGVDFNDNVKIRLGTGNDLEIYHDPQYGHSFIKESGSGALIIGCSGFEVYDAAISEKMIRAFANGAVELYHNNSKKAFTGSTGFNVSGNCDLVNDNDKLQLGNDADLKIYHDGTTNIIEGLNGNMSIRPKTGENGILLRNNGAVELYFDDSKKLETTSAGGTLIGTWNVGKVLQVVEGRKTDKFATTSGSFTDIPSLNVSITPSSSSNKILIRAVVSTGMGGGGIDGFLALKRGNTSIRLDQCTRMGGSEQNETIVLERLDTPSTTSSITYKVQCKVSSNEIFINRDGSNDQLGESVIIAMEVAA